MRKVFTSARIENVEGVAKYLGDADIDVRLVNGRSYRSAIRGNFSYREQTSGKTQPEVWVLRSEDYPRARQLLREAGLEQRGHVVGGGFAGPSMHGGTGQTATARRPASRARRGALIAVALAVAAGYCGLRWAASRAPAPPAEAAATRAPAATGASIIADPPAIHRQPTPPALAALLVENALADTAADARVCVTIDGETPSADFGNAALRRRIAAAADCAGTALRLQIGSYRTDGSGTGTVEVSTARSQAAPAVRILEVERTGFAWRVLGNGSTAQ